MSYSAVPKRTHGQTEQAVVVDDKQHFLMHEILNELRKINVQLASMTDTFIEDGDSHQH